MPSVGECTPPQAMPAYPEFFPGTQMNLAAVHTLSEYPIAHAVLTPMIMIMMSVQTNIHFQLSDCYDSKTAITIARLIRLPNIVVSVAVSATLNNTTTVELLLLLLLLALSLNPKPVDPGTFVRHFLAFVSTCLEDLGGLL